MITGLVILGLVVGGFLGGFYLGGKISDKIWKGGTKAGRIVVATTVGAVGAAGGAAIGNSVTSEPAAIVEPISETSLGFIEQFEQSNLFTQTSDNVYISAGRVVWNFSRSGGEQYVYRSISQFEGDVRLVVEGQINDWTNNCGVSAGIGDKPGSGVAVNFGFYGGGCSMSGPVVRAGGVSLDMQEKSCSFSGTWPWIEAQRDYKVELIVRGSNARLSVPSVATVEGTKTYNGRYTTLWVGGYGGGDWPTCSGTIESVTVEPLQ